jgi:hypothetical protein
MTEARWEWMLPGSVRVAATLASPTGVESVFVAGSLASQSARGAKPDGHSLKVARSSDDGELEPLDVSVTFDPRVRICVLRVAGEEIAPQVWPITERGRAVRPPPTAPFPTGIVTAVVGAVVIAGFASGVLLSRGPSAGPNREMSGVHRAESGLFVAHFPKSFVARSAVMPSAMTGIVLSDDKRGETIVIVALPPSEAMRDPWLLHKRVHGEALVNLPRADGKYDELSRRDDACLGQPGAIVAGRVTNQQGEPARVWSCAFSRGDTGYLVMSSLREKSPAEDEKQLRRIIDATELTELGALTPLAPQ